MSSNYLQTILNSSIHLQEGNSVLIDTKEYGFLIFSLLVKETCPFGTELCKKICYGRNAQELFKHVYNSRLRNLKESKKETFADDMINIINYNLQRRKYKNKIILFRIHETGDFYGKEYMDKWIKITNFFKDNPRIKFQAYTKSLPYLENRDLSQINIKLMYSVMPDTEKENIEKAKNMGMNIFYAVPYEQFENIKESQKCKGDCGNCKVCYLDNKDMFVEFHGNRAPRNRARKDYDGQLYWYWKFK